MSKTQEEIAAEASQAAASAARADGKKEGEPSPDYKKMYEDTQKELGQAQHTIVKLKTEGNPKGENGSDDDIEKKVESSVQKALEADRAKRNSETLIETEISKMTTNPEEQQKIRDTYNTKIVKTGSSDSEILADLNSARILANAPKLQATLKEIEEKQKSNPNTSVAGGGSGGQFSSDSQGAQGNWSDADKNLLAAYGVDTSKAN